VRSRTVSTWSWDPAPGAPERLRASVANAWPALERVGLAPGADPARLRFAATIAECVADADFIQESAPEREALKLELHEQISRAAKPDAIIASSTSGLLPSDFYARATHPERCVVGHPFNPVYCCRSSRCSAASARRRRPSKRR
jgi:carnitine 3-dehydrogenase